MFSKQKLAQLKLVLFQLIVFLTPTNLFFILTEKYAYQTGLRVDYLIPKIYLVEIFISLALLIYLMSVINRKHLLSSIKSKPVWLITLVLLLSFQLFTTLPVIGVWTLLSWILLLTVAIIFHREKFLETKEFYQCIALTVIFQATVGILQFIKQSSLIGYLFLGETNLTSFSGLAKTSIFGAEKVLAYGTTAHPNILGGYLAIFCLILVVGRKKINRISYIASLVLGMSCLMLTASVSAVLTFLIGLLTLYTESLNKIIQTSGKLILLLSVILLPILLSFANSFVDLRSIERRVILNDAAFHLFLNQPFGVGVGQFVVGVEEFVNTDEVVRFLQPVHHVPLLLAVELGLIGLVIIGVTVSKYPNLNLPLMILGPILLLDHYLVSLTPGRLLLIISCLFFTNWQRKL